MTSVAFRFYRLIILKAGKTKFVAIITETVEVSGVGIAAKQYGLKNGEKAVVPIEVLPLGSYYLVDVACDICGAIESIPYHRYIKKVQLCDGKYICSNRELHQIIGSVKELELCKSAIMEFYSQHEKFPVIADFPIGASKLSYKRVFKAFKNSGITYRDFRSEVDPHAAFTIANYDVYKSEYVRVLKGSSETRSMFQVYKQFKDLRLPTPTWMVKNCPNKNVSSTYDWMTWAGLFHSKQMPKQIARSLILKLSRKYKRPLMYDDFRKIQPDRPTIATITKYWGSLNAMKRDLGLEVLQESMVDRHLSDEDMIAAISSACKEISAIRGDDLIATQDLSESALCPAAQTINVFVKEKFGVTLTEYVQSLGYRTIEPGRGLSRVDEFGERFESRYEELFSLYLQSIGLSYLNHYYRSVKYSDICGADCGARNCDYKIEYNGRLIYVEIAGILGQYKQFYIDNRKITSSQSKERYRIKLMEKEAMLTDAGVEYFILFPCDLSHDILGFIFNGEYSEAKSLIRSHYKNNIHWKNIDPGRGVEYDWTRIGRDGQPRVVV